MPTTRKRPRTFPNGRIEIALRLSDDLYRKLTMVCDLAVATTNAYVVRALEQAVLDDFDPEELAAFSDETTGPRVHVSIRLLPLLNGKVREAVRRANIHGKVSLNKYIALVVYKAVR